MKTRIALLGQPNAGKSTVFNALTGARQHVGNWPGKTVERADGYFAWNGVRYTVTDLPGSYGLLGSSEEERITASFIRSGQADLVCVLVDASQLERSLYMVAELAPLDVPAVIVLNMMDVAKRQHKRIDANRLSERLGVPVLPFVATDRKQYDALKALLAKELKHPHRLCAASSMTDDAKFRWMQAVLAGVTERRQGTYHLSRLDRIATAPIAGKALTLGVVLAGMGLAVLISQPFAWIGALFPKLLNGPVRSALTEWGVHPWLVSIFSLLLPNVLNFACSMAGFVFGVHLILGLLEQSGFLARVAYQFDGLLSRLGLQGKAICPILMGFGCTVGGVTGTRVLDNRGDRMLSMAIVWAVPCGATWGVVPTVASMFFSPWQTLLLCVAIVACMPLVMWLASLVFGGALRRETAQSGMVMELPPYHRVHPLRVAWDALLKTGDVFRRAIVTITLTSLLFWLLSFSASGSVQDSLLYRFGVWIEPVTRAFGLGWQTFLGFVSAAFAKEAVLGTLNAVFIGQGSLLDATFLAAQDANSGALAVAMTQVVSKPEAAAFLFACTFGVPCVMTLGATWRETHSLGWTLRFMLFYACLAPLLSFAVYHIAALLC